MHARTQPAPASHTHTRTHAPMHPLAPPPGTAHGTPSMEDAPQVAGAGIKVPGTDPSTLKQWVKRVRVGLWGTVWHCCCGGEARPHTGACKRVLARMRLSARIACCETATGSTQAEHRRTPASRPHVPNIALSPRRERLERPGAEQVRVRARACKHACVLSACCGVPSSMDTPMMMEQQQTQCAFLRG